MLIREWKGGGISLERTLGPDWFDLHVEDLDWSHVGVKVAIQGVRGVKPA